MAAWTKLLDGDQQECTSSSHNHPTLAQWRLEAGNRGSFYCGDCMVKIDRLDEQYAANIKATGDGIRRLKTES